jgi:AGZA family xanthine/uracil permease-like MFS transporter
MIGINMKIKNRLESLLLRPGDLNAFFGLIVDNMTQLVIMASILVGIFQFPREIVYGKMIPGSAIGVFVGDLVYTIMAIRLARRTGRSDITAMPLGIDTPSLFAFTFGVIGPAYVVTKDAALAWKISMAVIILVGLVKTAGAFLGPMIQRAVPRAGLLGPIAGVALLLIAFLPLLKIMHHPLVGFFSLIVILTCIVGKIPFPFRIPAAFAAVLLGIFLSSLLGLFGHGSESAAAPPDAIAWTLPLPTFQFLDGLPHVLAYLPIALPFAIIVIIGGIDVTESAAAAGDEYDTRSILLTSGLSTVASGLCGGVVQTTPYIGHPAYKEMGGGAGYTLATALFIGFAGIFGLLGGVVDLLPEAAVAPILIFIGLEITAQAFGATPREHYKAVAFSFLPVIAALILIELNGLLGHLGKRVADLQGETALTYQAMLLLSNGFVVSSLLWGGALAEIIDRRLWRAALFFGTAGVLSLFGVIHSPFEDGRLFFPWGVETMEPFLIGAAYGLMAGFLIGMAVIQKEASR